VWLLSSCLVLNVFGLASDGGAFGADDNGDEGESGEGFLGDRRKCEVGEGRSGEFACLGVASVEMRKAGVRDGELNSISDTGLVGELGSYLPEAMGPVSRDSRRPIFARMKGVIPCTGSGDVEPAGVGK